MNKVPCKAKKMNTSCVLGSRVSHNYWTLSSEKKSNTDHRYSAGAGSQHDNVMKTAGGGCGPTFES